MEDDRASPAEPLRIAFEMFELGVDMMRQSLIRRFPGESETQIEGRLGDWLETRPGAEYGDSWGRPIPIRERAP